MSKRRSTIIVIVVVLIALGIIAIIKATNPHGEVVKQNTVPQYKVTVNYDTDNFTGNNEYSAVTDNFTIGYYGNDIVAPVPDNQPYVRRHSRNNVSLVQYTPSPTTTPTEYPSPVVPIPEASTVILLGMGLVILSASIFSVCKYRRDAGR